MKLDLERAVDDRPRLADELVEFLRRHLPIAVGALAATHQLPLNSLENAVFIGEPSQQTLFRRQPCVGNAADADRSRIGS